MTGAVLPRFVPGLDDLGSGCTVRCVEICLPPAHIDQSQLVIGRDGKESMRGSLAWCERSAEVPGRPRRSSPLRYQNQGKAHPLRCRHTGRESGWHKAMVVGKWFLPPRVPAQAGTSIGQLAIARGPCLRRDSQVGRVTLFQPPPSRERAEHLKPPAARPNRQSACRPWEWRCHALAARRWVRAARPDGRSCRCRAAA